MRQISHVLGRRLLGKELLRASFAGKLRRPVANSRHVLACSVLRAKVLCATLAIEARGPVVCVVHVLIAGTLSTEGFRASLALRPVIMFVHVVLDVFSVVEGGGTGLALVHAGLLVPRR